jgi:hypothetical protein
MSSVSKGEQITLNEGPVPTPGGPGKGTSEFAATLAVIVANVIAVLVLLGYVSAKDSPGLVDSINAIIGAVAVAVPNVLGLWAYIRSRVELKRQAQDDALAREELRLAHELNVKAIHLKLKQPPGGEGSTEEEEGD